MENHEVHLEDTDIREAQACPSLRAWCRGGDQIAEQRQNL